MDAMDSPVFFSFKAKFGHYAFSVTLPLRTALFDHDYDYSDFKCRFRFSGTDHEDDLTLRDFMEKLIYDESDYFTTEELRFVIHVSATYGMSVSDEQIKLDREELLSKKGSAATMKAVNYMLKTIDFYQHRYKPNFTEWCRKYEVAFDMCKLRGRLTMSEVIQPVADTAADDGYYTDEDQEGGGQDSHNE